MTDNTFDLSSINFENIDTEIPKKKIIQNFGLNTGFITFFGYEGENFKVKAKIGDVEYTQIIFEPKLFQGQTKDQLEQNNKHSVAVMTHFVKAIGFSETQIRTALSQTKKKKLTMKEIYEIYIKLFNSKKDFNIIPLDFFFQYQWSIKKGARRTFLELPRKTTYGLFLCRHKEPKGEWKAIREDNGGLIYQDDEGNIHPFKRNDYFMNSAFARLQENKDTGNKKFAENYNSSEENSWVLPFISDNEEEENSANEEENSTNKKENSANKKENSANEEEDIDDLPF